MENNYCLHNLLKLICLLQDNSTSACFFQNECQKPFLGPTTINPYYNTRVVSFYKKDGTLIDHVKIENAGCEYGEYDK